MKAPRSTSLPIILTAIFLNGCATSRLWEANHFAKFGEPAPDPKLQLFRADHRTDVLVEYDELPSEKGGIRRRAYFLYENDPEVQASRKPKFIARPTTASLRLIPLFYRELQPGTEPTNDLFAVVSTNGHKFTLFGPDNRLGLSYELPVYRTSSGRLTQVLWTPPTLIADATIIGGVLIVICWPDGYSFSP